MLDTPYFTENPGDQLKAWDTQRTFDWMPSQFFTLRLELVYRVLRARRSS